MHTPGPLRERIATGTCDRHILSDKDPIAVIPYKWGTPESRAAWSALFCAAPDLLEAEEKQEAAELAHANCTECLGEGVPELCEKCFPLFDDARLSRRAAIAKARDS